VFSKGTTDEIPSKGDSPHPTVPDINITAPGVFKLLNNTNPNKATGLDSIPGKFLRDLAQEISPALPVIFRVSLHQGSIPSKWSKAAVVTLFKKGKASNYRPVSLTSITVRSWSTSCTATLSSILGIITSYKTTNMALERKDPVKANLLSPFRTWPMDSPAGTNLTVSLLAFLMHLIKFRIEDSSTNASSMESEETPCSGLRASCKDAHNR
jgi:hypothetical protein